MMQIAAVAGGFGVVAGVTSLHLRYLSARE